MNTKSLNQNIEEQNLNRDLRLNLKALEHSFATKNIKMKLSDDRSLNDFLKLPGSEKNRVLRDVSRNVEFLPQGRRMTLQAEKEILSKHLSILNLEPYDDIYSFLEKGDVVEIYDKNFLQLYRNWEFVNLCSYTYLDLATRPFFELFDRSPQITNAIVNRVQEILSLAEGTKKYEIA